MKNKVLKNFAAINIKRYQLINNINISCILYKTYPVFSHTKLTVKELIKTSPEDIILEAIVNAILYDKKISNWYNFARKWDL